MAEWSNVGEMHWGRMMKMEKVILEQEDEDGKGALGQANDDGKVGIGAGK